MISGVTPNLVALSSSEAVAAGGTGEFPKFGVQCVKDWRFNGRSRRRITRFAGVLLRLRPSSGQAADISVQPRRDAQQ